jgi:hypothetical protein
LFIATADEAAAYRADDDDDRETAWRLGPEPDEVDWSGLPE